MRCAHCGKEIGNNRYCPYCGHKNEEGNESMKVWLILLTIFTAGIFVLEVIQTALLFV